MRDELVWMVIGAVGFLAGLLHFCVEPVHLTGRAWDAAMGAAMLGNLFMVAVNAVELRDLRRADRERAARR